MSRAHAQDGGYPVSPLKDLFLAELAAANPDSFSPTRPLRSSRTAAGRRALPCCIVRETPPRASDGSFYYGADAKKYVLLQLAGGGPPIRATRWLAGAVEGQTVCHSCDTPACIAVAHLQVEDQAFNLAECLSRKRRHPPTSSTPQHHRHRHHSNTQPHSLPGVDQAEAPARPKVSHRGPPHPPIPRTTRPIHRGSARMGTPGRGGFHHTHTPPPPPPKPPTPTSRPSPPLRREPPCHARRIPLSPEVHACAPRRARAGTTRYDA